MIETIKVFEAFAGYGSQAMALKRLENEFPGKVHFEFVGISEIDKYAIQAYRAVHGDTKNYGDISKVEWDKVPDFDLFTYSFPCQDISNAGLQRGLSEGSGTRSSLLWECCKAIEAKKPKYLLMENVKALTSKKFMPYLLKWEAYLRGLGYSNFTKVLNAKDYGIPQNRERVFMVSMLSDEFYTFPQPFKLQKRLKDVLEDNVDEKYYLPQKAVDSIDRKIEILKEDKESSPICLGNTNPSGHGINGNVFSSEGLSPTLTTNKGEGPKVCTGGNAKVIYVGRMNASQDGKIAHADGLSYTLTSGHNNCPKVLIPQATAQDEPPMRYECTIIQAPHGYMKGNIQEVCPSITTSSWQHNNFYVEKKDDPLDNFKEVRDAAEYLRRIASDKRKCECGVTIGKDFHLRPFTPTQAKNGVAELQTDFSESIGSTLISARPNMVYGPTLNYRIRKLTPRECFRLMGVSEADIDKIQAAGISNSQQYKMAGNSIVVDVLLHIFRKMFVEKQCESGQLSLF